MNLELPFHELTDAELDEYLARIDRELDALFLEDVAKTLAELRAAGFAVIGSPAPDAAAA